MSNPIVVLFIPDSFSSLKWSFHPHSGHITMPLRRGGVHTINLRALQGVVQGFPRPQGEGVVRVLDGIDLHIEKLEHLHAFGPLGGGSIHGPYWFIMFGKGEL
jgi:hypothetical protein